MCDIQESSINFTPLIYTLSVIAIIYISLIALRQIDLKKIIAYSSVAHMNFITLGLFSLNIPAIQGSVLLMISHGIVSPALFLAVGVLYDRYKTRFIKYYAGWGRIMPLFAIIVLFFTMCNISLPGTSSFVGEFLVLTGSFLKNSFIAVLATTGIVLGAGYALLMCNRVIYGLLNPYHIFYFSDLSRREVLIFIFFFFSVLWIGLFPQSFLDSLHISTSLILQDTNLSPRP